MTSPRLERDETRSLLLGYGFALLLTLAAFGLVILHVLTGREAFYAVLGLGLIQLVVHLRFFLYLGFSRSAAADLQLILFSSLIIALMVGGTLVVLFNLRARMMGNFPQALTHVAIVDTGLSLRSPVVLRTGG